MREAGCGMRGRSSTSCRAIRCSSRHFSPPIPPRFSRASSPPTRTSSAGGPSGSGATSTRTRNTFPKSGAGFPRLGHTQTTCWSCSLLPKVVESIRAAKDPLTVKDLAVKGDDLLAAGVRPGPDVGETLERLLAEVLEDPSRNTRDYLLSRV